MKTTPEPESPCVNCQDKWSADRNTNCREACPRLRAFKQATVPKPVPVLSEADLEWVLAQPYCPIFVGIEGRNFRLMKYINGIAYVIHEGRIEHIIDLCEIFTEEILRTGD